MTNQLELIFSHIVNKEFRQSLAAPIFFGFALDLFVFLEIIVGKPSGWRTDYYLVALGVLASLSFLYYLQFVVRFFNELADILKIRIFRVKSTGLGIQLKNK